MFSRRFAIASLRFVLVFTLVILALPASAYAVKPAAATDPVAPCSAGPAHSRIFQVHMRRGGLAGWP